MRNIYLSGPMSGLPDFNHAAFHDETFRLREIGYSVFNPAEANSKVMPRQICLRRDLIELLQGCDTLALLDGWESSEGVFLEMFVARSVGIPIVLAREIVREGQKA
jgi:hypothetical protein